MLRPDYIGAASVSLAAGHARPFQMTVIQPT
jgi:hypothetical protein